jgi:hypothetical protein
MPASDVTSAATDPITAASPKRSTPSQLQERMRREHTERIRELNRVAIERARLLMIAEAEPVCDRCGR